MTEMSEPRREGAGMSLRDKLSTTFASWDFAIGVGAGVFAALLSLSAGVREQGPTLLLAELAVGLGVVAAVLSALAILTTFFDGHYRRVLEEVGGIRRAMLPYLVVAAVAGICAVVALLVALGWPAFGAVVRTLLLGLATGLAVWTITIFHGTQRAGAYAQDGRPGRHTCRKAHGASAAVARRARPASSQGRR